jgi:hypothetical protein
MVNGVYKDALVQWYVAVVAAAFSILEAVFIEWKSVKREKLVGETEVEV